MLVSFHLPANEHERFSPEAAQGLIGQTFQANFELSGHKLPLGVGTVLEAVVVNEGRGIDIQVDWPELEK